MDQESRRALRQISKIRGCSWEDARYFCSQIQACQEEVESSYIDIAEVLQVFEGGNESYSDREIARRAEEITKAKLPENRTQREDLSPEITVDHPRIEKFEGPGDHQAFMDWIDRNPVEGFVLNLRGADSDPVIHSANCSHLDPNPRKDRVATSRVKLCSTDRKALRNKALNLAEGTIVLCQHCDV